MSELTREQIDLKPCPFCGGVVILEGDDLPYVVPSGTVVCDDCGAQAHVDFWNRRPPVTQGSVVVPREPTEAMLTTIADYLNGVGARAIYKAMLSAHEGRSHE